MATMDSAIHDETARISQYLLSVISETKHTDTIPIQFLSSLEKWPDVWVSAPKTKNFRGLDRISIIEYIFFSGWGLTCLRRGLLPKLGTYINRRDAAKPKWTLIALLASKCNNSDTNAEHFVQCIITLNGLYTIDWNVTVDDVNIIFKSALLNPYFFDRLHKSIPDDVTQAFKSPELKTLALLKCPGVFANRKFKILLRENYTQEEYPALATRYLRTSEGSSLFIDILEAAPFKQATSLADNIISLVEFFQIRMDKPEPNGEDTWGRNPLIHLLLRLDIQPRQSIRNSLSCFMIIRQGIKMDLLDVEYNSLAVKALCHFLPQDISVLVGGSTFSLSGKTREKVDELILTVLHNRIRDDRAESFQLFFNFLKDCNISLWRSQCKREIFDILLKSYNRSALEHYLCELSTNLSQAEFDSLTTYALERALAGLQSATIVSLTVIIRYNPDLEFPTSTLNALPQLKMRWDEISCHMDSLLSLLMCSQHPSKHDFLRWFLYNIDKPFALAEHQFNVLQWNHLITLGSALSRKRGLLPRNEEEYEKFHGFNYRLKHDKTIRLYERRITLLCRVLGDERSRIVTRLPPSLFREVVSLF
mmetsp:Transcript_48364/g.55655  ORF Transcript_48364/g.55655 Transcript_48364/m.55655 type:complete len:591 (+) Transcript_48364:300-2072(+)